MPVPATISTIGEPHAVPARLARTRCVLRARHVADTLAQATAALAEALDDDPLRAEVWRVAANHTSTLLRLLQRGAAGLGRPLPEETLAVAHALRGWAVTTASHHRAGLVVVLAPPPRPIVTPPPRPPATQPVPGRGHHPVGDRQP